MKTSTSLLAAAAGLLSMASMASAQSVCAIQCFQGVITDHPPMDCTEENMYLCFCKSSSLQNYFIECLNSTCPNDVDASLEFGVQICAGYGVNITPPTTSPETTAAAPQPEPTTEAPVQSPPAQETPAETPVQSQPAQETPAQSRPAQETPVAQPSSTQAAVQPGASSHSTVVVPVASTTTAAAAGSATPTVVQVAGGVANAASGMVMAAGAFVAAINML